MMLIKTFLYQEGCPIAQTLEAVIDKNLGFSRANFYFYFCLNAHLFAAKIFLKNKI